MENNLFQQHDKNHIEWVLTRKDYAENKSQKSVELMGNQ